MKKMARIFITFIISFLVIYLVGCYITQGLIRQTHWDVGATIWNKLKDYYIRTAPYNVKPVLIISLIITAYITIDRELKG